MVTPQKPSRAHHHTAQHYLRRFCAPGLADQLYVHRRAWANPKLLHTKVAAQQTRLYSLANPDPAVPIDAVEQALREVVDGPASTVLPKVANGERLTTDERLTFALHLGVQALRSPWMRQQHDRVVEFVALGTLRSQLVSDPDAAARSASHAGTAVSSQDIARLVSAIDKGRVSVKGPRDSWPTLLLEAILTPGLPSMIASMPWLVVRTYTGEFVTSDNPIVKTQVQPAAFKEGESSWTSPAIETTYALDPEHVLVIRADLTEGTATASAKWRRDVNRRCVLFAYEEFYARTTQPALHKRFRESEAPEMITALDTKPPGTARVTAPFLEGLPFS